MTILNLYIDDIETSLDKGRLKNLKRQLYMEAQDLQI
jgi:hypothetical protein